MSFKLITTAIYRNIKSQPAKLSLLDEFLPLITFKDPLTFPEEDGKIEETDEKEVLSQYIEAKKRTLKVKAMTSKKRKLKLPFKIEKGNSNSADDDGLIDIKISNTKDVELKSTKQLNGKYNSDFEVEIEIKANDKIEFYVNFYASDNEGDTWSKGEHKDVHCGQFKIIFNYCVCTDWPTVLPVIPASKFIGWGHSGVTVNCYHYSLEQLRQAGHWVKTERWNKNWDGTKELNNHIYQLFLEADVAGMTSGVQKDQFKKGVEYLKKTITKNIPIMVGVDDDKKLDNDDMTTEHFVVIVGMGTDAVGNYFLFYDNAVSSSTIGTSADNKLYCKCNDFKLEGKGSVLNDYIQSTSKKKYLVTQIRETK